MPSERSVYLTRRLIPGAETLSSFAAPPMVPVTITARITSTWRSVIMSGRPGMIFRDHLTEGARPSSDNILGMEVAVFRDQDLADDAGRAEFELRTAVGAA